MERIIFDHFPHLTEQQREQFAALDQLYRYWNERVNLISRQDIENLYPRHILHSLAIAHYLPKECAKKVLDVGTGGGFPGIPLAILYPETQFLLVDSIGKKIRVVEAIIDSLQLKNCRAEVIRAEQLKERFDYVVSRAVTSLPRFIPWVWDKLHPSTEECSRGILYLKGGELEEEIEKTVKECKIAREAIVRHPISNHYSDEWFKEKEVLFIKRQ